MTYHLFWQLELLSNKWVTLATQRYGDPAGPQSPGSELTETELNWCVFHTLSIPVRDIVLMRRV